MLCNNVLSNDDPFFKKFFLFRVLSEETFNRSKFNEHDFFYFCNIWLETIFNPFYEILSSDNFVLITYKGVWARNLCLI